jgi:choline kinase
MPVTILAAGRGNRLSPLTDETPKCLLPIGSTCPLALLLDALSPLPEVSEVLIVVGHARQRVESFLAEIAPRLAVHLVGNPRYDTANNIVSAHLLAGRCDGGFLLVNSDVVCHPDILRDALTGEEGSVLIVDPTLPPRDEAMKVRFEAGRLVAIAKTLDPAAADGEYIGITRFDARGAAAFFQAIRDILDEGGTDEWYEAAIARAAREVPFGLRSTQGHPWIEIDDHADLERARREVLPRLGSSKTLES